MRTKRGLLLVVWVLALAIGALPAAAQDGGSKGVLYIPAIDLIACVVDAPIVNRAHVIPDRDVGHLAGTAWLDDDWARIVLAGHTPGVFERLDELRRGDVIWLFDQGRAERYVVVLMTLTDISDWDWLAPTDDETLTLITCTEDETRRLIVHAEQSK